jgi:serine/threonine protein phosphatase PrpC
MKRIEISDLGRKWRTVRRNFYLSTSVHCIVDKIGGDPNCGLFAIFDGHGGK